VETYSEGQSNRSVHAFRGPAGQTATVIVMRRHGQVWLVLNGAEATTIVMTDPEAHQMRSALDQAAHGWLRWLLAVVVGALRNGRRCGGAPVLASGLPFRAVRLRIAPMRPRRRYRFS
jgi:hypothetical protein